MKTKVGLKYFVNDCRLGLKLLKKELPEKPSSQKLIISLQNCYAFSLFKLCYFQLLYISINLFLLLLFMKT